MRHPNQCKSIFLYSISNSVGPQLASFYNVILILTISAFDRYSSSSYVSYVTADPLEQIKLTAQSC